MDRRLTRTLLAACVLAAAASSAPARADVFNLTVSNYTSPDFTNTGGTSRFIESGINTAFTLNPGSSVILPIDALFTPTFDPNTTNSSTTLTFNGSAPTVITVNGTSQSSPDPYSLLTIGTPPYKPTFSGGPDLTYTFGAETLDVKLVPSVGGRQAMFTLTGSVATVPEPGPLALAGLGACCAGCGWFWRSRGRLTGRAKALAPAR